MMMAAAAGAARAAACHFEGGVIVVPAEVDGVAGDFILDTGAARTALHDTRAGAAGIAEAAVVGKVRVDGVEVAGQSVAVEDLDVRTWNLPTPVAGVIGVDVLKGFVVDVSFAPCAVRLHAPGRAPRFAGTVLPMTWDGGLPTIEAAAADGTREVRGPFVPATGANVPVRLADDLARAPGAARPDELYPQGVWLARLGALAFAGTRQPDLGAGLMTPQGGIAGVIGGAALARFRLRFDFPRGRLVVAPGRAAARPARGRASRPGP
jgi:hypothetical protein